MTTAPHRKRLGELAVARGWITPQQLDEAIEEQRRTRQFLGAILTARGWMTAAALLDLLAEQFGLERIELKSTVVDWRVAKRFSPSLLIDHQCVPLYEDAALITVAVCNPLDATVISALEQAMGDHELRVVLITEEEMRELLRQYRHQTTLQIDRLLGDTP